MAASSCGFCSDTILSASSYHPVTASQLETQQNSSCTGGVRAASCPCLPAHPSTHRTCFSEGTKMGTNSPLAHAKTVLFWKAATSATFQVCTPELFSASAQAVWCCCIRCGKKKYNHKDTQSCTLQTDSSSWKTACFLGPTTIFFFQLSLVGLLQNINMQVVIPMKITGF